MPYPQDSRPEEGAIEISLHIQNPDRFFRWLALVLAALVLFRNLWIADDAFITMRVVDNWVNGYGLTWNIGERVQVFTNPLWTFIVGLVYLVFREPHAALYLLSFLTSLSVLALLILRTRGSYRGALVVMGLLVTSRAFVDYSSSGLENPLSHLLVATFAMVFLHPAMTPGRQGALLGLLAGLATLNRLDLLLLFAPALGMIVWQYKPAIARTSLLVALGFMPLFLWLGFATVYYGFPLPNTFYAKTGTGLPILEAWAQGNRYFENSINFDPITLIVIVLIVVLLTYFKEWRRLILVAGGLIYFGYVLMIGGDFMTGRFFSAPFVLSLAALASSDFERWLNLGNPRLLALTLFLIAAVGLSANDPPLLLDRTDANGNLTHGGVADEKLFYYHQTGILNYLRRGLPHNFGLEGLEAAQSGVTPIMRNSIGFFGYYAGPGVYIIDVYALADPLRARLPAATFRPGHFERPVPEGYADAITQQFDASKISDPDLREYYNLLKTLTQESDLLAENRLQLIWEFNTGQYDYLLDLYLRRSQQ